MVVLVVRGLGVASGVGKFCFTATTIKEILTLCNFFKVQTNSDLILLLIAESLSAITDGTGTFFVSAHHKKVPNTAWISNRTKKWSHRDIRCFDVDSGGICLIIEWSYSIIVQVI